MITQNTKIEIRMTNIEKSLLKQRAIQFGFKSLSEYIRVIALKGKLDLT